MRWTGDCGVCIRIWTWRCDNQPCICTVRTLDYNLYYWISGVWQNNPHTTPWTLISVYTRCDRSARGDQSRPD